MIYRIRAVPAKLDAQTRPPSSGIAVILAVSTALLAATASLGWLLAFGLQTAFYWTVFLCREDIAARFALATGANDRAPARGRLPRALRNMPRQLRRATTPWPAQGRAQGAAAQPRASSPHASPTGPARNRGGARSGYRARPARQHVRAPEPRPEASVETPTPDPPPRTAAGGRQDSVATSPPRRRRARTTTTTAGEQSSSAPRPGRPARSGSSDRARTPGAAARSGASVRGRTTEAPKPSTQRRDGERDPIRDDLERDRRRLDERAPRGETDSSAPRLTPRFPWRRP
jgi:hypothetical protein